ncbi:MAG: PPOX class F420-dependent oxidoreductase [Candidatus Limnocylindria bacterium]
MTDYERRTFLLHGTRTAILSTTRDDGQPVAVPVGFTLDGDDVLILTHERSVKARALERDPRVSLVVSDDTPPFAYVAIEGRATGSLEHDDPRKAATAAIGRRYAGPEAVEAFAQYADASLGMLVRVRPTRIVARDRVGEG